MSVPPNMGAPGPAFVTWEAWVPRPRDVLVLVARVGTDVSAPGAYA